MEILETIDHYDHKICIIQDTDPWSPRDSENLGTIVSFHRRYNLSDKHDFKQDDYSCWEELSKAIAKKHGKAVILPLYLYDHSGIVLSTTPFSCPWDSGQVGFVFMTHKEIRKSYHIKRVSKNLIKTITEYLVSEVIAYSNYLNGEVYGCVCYGPDGDELDDSISFGYFGSDHEVSGLMDHAKQCIGIEYDLRTLKKTKDKDL